MAPRKQELPRWHARREHRHEHRNSHTPQRSNNQSRRTAPSHSTHKDPSKTWKAHFVAASGEFIGTMMFLYFGFAVHLMTVTVQLDGGTSPQTVVFISLGYGFSLLVTAWVFYRISGGLFNPAVTLGLVLSGALPAVRGLILFPLQLLGSIAAAALIHAMFPGPVSLVNTKLEAGTSIAQGLFIEMFLTCLLIITVLMLAAEKSKDTFIAPIGIGLALFVAELAGVYYTGGSLNPARSFGPAVISGEFPTYHWIYWVGPGLGALVTTLYFRLVKLLNYEEANPGQDSAGGNFIHD